MKKIFKYLITILALAWTGALTIFAGIVFITCLFTIADKLFNNNLFVCTIMALLLIAATLIIGSVVKNRVDKGNGNA